MGLLQKIAVGTINVVVDSLGSQMRSIEGRSRDSGRPLKSEFYDRKESYNRIKSDYERRKKDMEE